MSEIVCKVVMKLNKFLKNSIRMSFEFRPRKKFNRDFLHCSTIGRLKNLASKGELNDHRQGVALLLLLVKPDRCSAARKAAFLLLVRNCDLSNAIWYARVAGVLPNIPFHHLMYMSNST